MISTASVGRVASLAQWTAVTLALLVLAGCGHRRQAAPPPPQKVAPPPAQRETPPPAAQEAPPARIPVTPAPQGGVDQEDIEYIASHRPILSERGVATWYTAPYKGRKAANGQLFRDNALTAAHRTLPMGSLIVVTNLLTGQSSPMRVTDRGPFVEGRIVDLTVASAKATGVYRVGSAEVRVDVYRTPKPIATGGRWCVQIGALSSEERAVRLKAQLLRKYPGSNVIEFPGDKSFWVRIRPQGDNRQQAESIAHHLKLSEGEAFLTRLD
jgi:rare lipoprotein A